MSYLESLELATTSTSPQSTSRRNAAYSKTYRQKRKQGAPPRHISTRDEQAALLTRPYNELSDKEKQRVRSYRHRDKKRQQQHQPSHNTVLTAIPSLLSQKLPPSLQSSSSSSKELLDKVLETRLQP